MTANPENDIEASSTGQGLSRRRFGPNSNEQTTPWLQTCVVGLASARAALR